MSTRTTATPQILVNGAALADRFLDALLSLQVDLSIHTAGRVTAKFEDPWMQLFDDGGIDIGVALVVKLPNAGGNHVPVFTGTVTSIGVENDFSSGSPMAQFVLEALDESHRLAVASTFEAHLKSPADVVKAIAGRHGLTPKIEAPKDDAKEPYILQADTDHAVLTQLADRYGYEWFTTGKELHFRPRPKIKKDSELSRIEGTLLHFSAKFAGTHSPKSVKVWGWDPSKAVKTDVAKEPKLADGDFGSNAKFVTEQRAKAVKAFGKELNVGEIASLNAKENEAIALSLAKGLAGAGLEAEGVAFCNPQIKPGEYLELDGLGKKLSGTYYVTSVSHSFGSDDELRTRFSCGGHRVERAPWRPSPGSTSSWATSGPVIGVVTNVKDQEPNGRVKVSFPSLGDVESAWARVVAMGAGPKRGVDFRPEVGDEVLVTFERGDPRLPVVLGGLWNGKTKHLQAGAADGGAAETRAMTSRSGHALLFSDGADGEAKGSAKRFVSLTTGDEKNKVVVNEKDGVTIEVPDGSSITLKAGAATLTLASNGNIEVKTAKGKFEVKAKDVALAATAKLEAKGTASALVDGGPKLDLKSSGMGTLQAGGILTVKGAMVKIN